MSAFDRLGAAAVDNGVRIEILVYGGSALLIASNFRFSTEDVDVADLTNRQPEWLHRAILDIALANRWEPDWINDAVTFHLSAVATRDADHTPFGSFPRGAGPYGLDVFVPTAEYLLALKLKAIRILDPVKGSQEASDILNLMKVADVADVAAAIAILAKFFPKTANSPDKHLFLLKRLANFAEAHDAPAYPIRDSGANTGGDCG